MKLTVRKRNQRERGHVQATAGRAHKRRRGQSLVELALLLPLLVLLLSVVIEGGLALNAWVRVNSAARDATRFASDQGRQGDTVNLVLYKLKGVDFGSSREITGSLNIDIFRVQVATTSTGTIPLDPANWKKDQIYNGNGSNNDAPRISNTTIENRLRTQGNSNSLKFVIIEVDFKYTPILGSLIAPGVQLPMTSYAIIQLEPAN